MRFSVVINNFNYSAFVGAAIESALAQTWRDLEVVVVDDGSTDSSWSTIDRYRDRATVLRQDNGGQGAAYNTGWAASRGDAVLFLDADDLLAPTAVEQAMAALAPDVAMVSFRLRLIDRGGRPLGGHVPYLIHRGDVRPILQRFVHFAGPPSSGNLYRRSAVACMFPLDAPLWRRAADTVPYVTAPFAGKVAAIEAELGSYRLHRGPRLGVFGNIDSTLRSALLAARHRQQTMQSLLRARAGVDLRGPFLPLPATLRARALSLRVAPNEHPYPDDTIAGLLRLHSEVLRHWPGYSRMEKALMTAWLTSALTLPRRLVMHVAAGSTSGIVKATIRRLLGRGGMQEGTR